MLYSFNLKSFPFVKEVTKVVRDTTWEITAKYNMLFFIQKGVCSFTSNNEVSFVKTGEIYFVPSGTHYKRQPVNDESCTITCIYFKTAEPIVSVDISKSATNIIEQKNLINESILSGNSDTMFFDTIYLQSKMTPSNFETLNNRIKNINMFSNRRPLMCHLLSSNALCDILIHLSQSTIDTISANSFLQDDIKIPPKLKHALNFIFQNYASPISLEHLSNYCQVTKQQMIRYFKNSLGTTPTKYILEFKVMKARELLYNQPNLDIKDISMMLGFDDQLYFSRMFKKITGETPSEFRYRSNNYPKTDN